MKRIAVDKEKADETQKVVSAEEKIAVKEATEAKELADKATASVASANKLLEESLKEVAKLE